MTIDPVSFATIVFQALCLLVILIACMLGVLSHLYDDTLLQRLALGVVAIGALVQLGTVLTPSQSPPGAPVVLTGGFALYALTTTIKLWRRWIIGGRPDHPFRRSTDFSRFDSHADSTPADAPGDQRARAAVTPQGGR